MTEYIEYQHNKDKRKRKGVCKQCGNTSDFICSKCKHRKQYKE